MRSLLLLLVLLTGCTTYDSSVHMKDSTIVISAPESKPCNLRCKEIRNPNNPYKEK